MTVSCAVPTYSPKAKQKLIETTPQSKTAAIP